MPLCAANYQQCDASSTPCCTVLYGCFQRRGRPYHQCRPYVLSTCVDGDDWLCPRPSAVAAGTSAAGPPSPPLPPHIRTAARFLSGLGPGVNIMSSNVRWVQLDYADYEGLAQRVGHVRLCGDLVENFVDWTTCPGRPWMPDGAASMSEGQLQDAFRARLLADPGFGAYKTAAQRFLAQRDMRVVLNPLHKKFHATLDEELIRRFWTVLLEEFDEASFPPERMAFEMANEPGCEMLHSLTAHTHDTGGVSSQSPAHICLLVCVESFSLLTLTTSARVQVCHCMRCVSQLSS